MDQFEGERSHETSLKDSATGNVVPAEIHDALLLNDIFDVEAEWASSRVRVRQKVREARLTQRMPQSLHWDWWKKSEALDERRLSPLGDARLIGMRQADQWQGVIWVETCDIRGAEHIARLGNPDRNLVYIPWLEVAPWNWDIPPDEPEQGSVQKRKFRGIGMQLLECAVLWSKQLEFKGRVGLHALPQSEAFYRANCGMTDLGPDAKCQSLRYFELDEEQAKIFLGGK